jgi:membrane fusion protein (multidrug efflux system)
MTIERESSRPATPAVNSSPAAGSNHGGQPADVQLLVTAPKSRRPPIVIAALLAVVAIVAVTTSYFLTGGQDQSTNDAYVEGRVIRISPKVSGQVIALHVDDNDQVKAGDVLLQIDPADYQAKVDQANAAVDATQSAVEQAKAVVLRTEANVGEAEAALRAADTEAQRLASDYRRYQAMGTDGVSEQQVETAKHAADAGNDQRDAAGKKLVATQAELNVAKTNIGTAQAQVESARAQLRFARLQLNYTTIVAPESGRVTKKNVEAGDFVGVAQPLISIVPDDRWVVANFKEIQLQHMRVGQPVEIRIDSYPDIPLKAHVQSLQSGTGARFELLPAENATGNWVKVVQRLPVKIVFDSGQPDVKRLAQGMSVEVSVDTRANAQQAEAR